MKREFSEAKREELYGILDAMDACILPPFLAWCSFRTSEFGDWADRLDIQGYMQRAEDYGNAIREMNSSTRIQIDENFEKAAEADRQYAEIVQEHAEEVQGQFAIISRLIQAINPDAALPAERGGTIGLAVREKIVVQNYLRAEGMAGLPIFQFADSLQEQQDAIKMLIEQNKIYINGKMVCKAQVILVKYLEMQGITDPAQQQKIYRMVLDTRPILLMELCVAEQENPGSAKIIRDEILKYYNSNYSRWKEEFTEKIFRDYLESQGYENPVERDFIVAMIKEEQPRELRQLFHAYFRNGNVCDAAAKQLALYYEGHIQDIGLYRIAEAFKEDENAVQPARVCGYYEYLWKLGYICHAEYKGFLESMEGKDSISSEEQEEICQFMLGRQKLMEMLQGPGDAGNSGNAGNNEKNSAENEKWSRGQIQCALQIQTTFSQAETPDFDQEFIAGLIGNMRAEGDFGVLEGTNKTGGTVYWQHINVCIGYHEKYSGKNITNLDLVQLYVDLVWKRDEGGCQDAANHMFGIGAFQWTDSSRSHGVFNRYLQEAGFQGMEDEGFQELVQKCLNQDPYEAVFVDESQVRDAELDMMLYELTSEKENNEHKNVYPHYIEKCSRTGALEGVSRVNQAALTISEEYIKPDTEKNPNTNPQRQAYARRWHEAWESQYSICEEEETMEGEALEDE